MYVCVCVCVRERRSLEPLSADLFDLNDELHRVVVIVHVLDDVHPLSSYAHSEVSWRKYRGMKKVYTASEHRRNNDSYRYVRFIRCFV